MVSRVLLVFPLLAILPAQDRIKIAAAANISFLAPALQKAFVAKAPSTTLDFVFGASGALAAQISNGLDVQVFLSADTSYPKKIASWGLSLGDPKVYAIGRLVLLSTRNHDLSKGLAVLQDPGVKQFAMANPEIAPYGRSAFQALTQSGLWPRVKAKVVTGQTIAQTLQMVLAGTGIGFVNHSALFAKELEKYRALEKSYIFVDPKTYDPIEQGFVLLPLAARNKSALAFAAFLTAPEGRAVFRQFGYDLPPE